MSVAPYKLYSCQKKKKIIKFDYFIYFSNKRQFDYFESKFILPIDFFLFINLFFASKLLTYDLEYSTYSLLTFSYISCKDIIGFMPCNSSSSFCLTKRSRDPYNIQDMDSKWLNLTTKQLQTQINTSPHIDNQQRCATTILPQIVYYFTQEQPQHMSLHVSPHESHTEKETLV